MHAWRMKRYIKTKIFKEQDKINHLNFLNTVEKILKIR